MVARMVALWGVLWRIRLWIACGFSDFPPKSSAYHVGMQKPAVRFALHKSL